VWLLLHQIFIQHPTPSWASAVRGEALTALIKSGWPGEAEGEGGGHTRHGSSPLDVLAARAWHLLLPESVSLRVDLAVVAAATAATRAAAADNPANSPAPCSEVRLDQLGKAVRGETDTCSVLIHCAPCLCDPTLTEYQLS
jgi:hypothetical protein